MTIVLLNGIEQHDVISYDIERGMIEREARDEWGNLLHVGPRFNPCQAIERVYGKIEVKGNVMLHLGSLLECVKSASFSERLTFFGYLAREVISRLGIPNVQPQWPHAMICLEEQDFQSAADLARIDLTTARLDLPYSRAFVDVVTERRRQITDEHFTINHDDMHDPGELAAAGASYAINAADNLFPQSQGDGHNEQPDTWPWDRLWWKPGTPRRDLVRAAALLIAEIEKLDRAANQSVKSNDQNA